MILLKGRKEIQSVSRKHIEKQVFQSSVKDKKMQKKYREIKSEKMLDITEM